VPSFDVVSEVDEQEVRNAVDQANRELDTRFDFKGKNAKFALEPGQVTMQAQEEFQLKQMLDILIARLTKRKIDARCLKLEPKQVNVGEARQVATVRNGIDSDLARQIVKLIKNEKKKVQAAVQEGKVRVSGKKRDDLQQVIALLKEQELDLPLQFENYRD